MEGSTQAGARYYHGFAYQLQMAIMEFSYWEQDGSRDIYYTLNFTEYKELNVPTANNDKPVDDTTGLKVRPVDLDQKIKEEQANVNKGKALFQKACDIMDVARKPMGITIIGVVSSKAII